MDLSGVWNVELLGEGKFVKKKGTVNIPGAVQEQGYGREITKDTEWVSGLHNTFWYERSEYSYAQEHGTNVPFLAQPPFVFNGLARYQRKVSIKEQGEYFLFIEITRWKVKAYVDGVLKGEIVSLVAPFEFNLGKLDVGEHIITVEADTSMQYPYRPDGHGVSDALGASWNGMGGEVSLLTRAEYEKKAADRRKYAAKHKREICVEDGKFFVDGEPTYFRGTHYGGDHPLTALPDTTGEYYRKMLRTIKKYGFNFVRCHSYCPPDAMFQAADEEDVYILVECDMWNVFNDGIEMNDVLKAETERILKAFGHHPSFVLFSPSNEPGGGWHNVLREWVAYARETDKKLGYEHRRLYTAQSGWHYDTIPQETTGTDFLYLHKTNFGELGGGIVRGPQGWNGRDYNSSIEGAKIPCMCHELGQWCVYPDFGVIDKFKGYLSPGLFKVFKQSAKAHGVLSMNETFTRCSGKRQMMFIKEDLEANYRTDGMYGYEYLDAHDYLGQGGALIGFLDAFWDSKGYVTEDEFKEICSETVILTRLRSYVYKNTESISTSIEVCHFGKEDLTDVDVFWELKEKYGEHTHIAGGVMSVSRIPKGGNTKVGRIERGLSNVKKSGLFVLEMSIRKRKEIIAKNHWDISIFVKDNTESKAFFTRDVTEAEDALKRGMSVVFCPFLSDMDYDCPGLSFRNSFWNAQMGPNWVRSMGLVTDSAHPAFQGFPTEEYGGWEWDDILSSARGIQIPPEIKCIARPIDDWNRNYSLGLIFEAKVHKGKLLFVSANLEGNFDDRPAAYALKKSLLSYAASDAFSPKQKIDFSIVSDHIAPLYKGFDIISEISMPGFEPDTPIKENEGFMAMADINPNTSCFVKNLKLPARIKIELTYPVAVTGIRYLAPQSDRHFLGVIKDYRLYGKNSDGKEKLLSEGTLKNCFEEQKIECNAFETDILYLEVLSTYGRGKTVRYRKEREGWFREEREDPQYLQVAELNIMFTGDIPVRHNDLRFWRGRSARHTEEIDD